MALSIQKYGGSSIPSPERIKAVAGHIATVRQAGHDVVVVMSAMGGTTDQLIACAQKMTATARPRELDALLATGEQVSTALTAMALHNLGVDACSFTGWQAGILTSPSHGSADIVDVCPYRIRAALEQGVIPLVAGFQGLEPGGADVTTLGRGGSDTTAVALAAALDADTCEIYTDVAGVYTADPKVVPEARPLARLTYQHMRDMAATGAQVLALPSVEYAQKHRVTLHVLSSYDNCPGTLVSDTPFEATHSQHGCSVIAVTHRRALSGLHPPTSAARRIPETVSDDGGRSTARSYPAYTGCGNVLHDECAATASLVGSGLCARPETAARLRGILSGEGVPFTLLTMTDTCMTLACPPAALADTVRVLHKTFLTHTAEPAVSHRGIRLALRP